MGFKKSVHDNITGWTGDADCDDAHAYLLERLQDFDESFEPSGTTVSSAVHGNLGEFITCCIGEDFEFLSHYHVFSANADQPLGKLAKPQIDLVWIGFAPDPADDIGIVQEVKTTCAEKLGYAKALVQDYAKLFGPTARFTLHSRLQSIASECRRRLRRPDLAPRVRELAGVSPETSTSIRLIPTLVHDRYAEPPRPHLVAVRQSLIHSRWDRHQVSPWHIGLSDLEDRLNRLACGD